MRFRIKSAHFALRIIVGNNRTEATLKKHGLRLFNAGEDTRHLPRVTESFLKRWREGLRHASSTIKENKQELLLCLWLVFERYMKQKAQGARKAPLHFLSHTVRLSDDLHTATQTQDLVHYNKHIHTEYGKLKNEHLSRSKMREIFSFYWQIVNKSSFHHAIDGVLQPVLDHSFVFFPFEPTLFPTAADTCFQEKN